ncbi:MAG: rRNA pseudouridine synthase [Saprospiraceae bacterium]|nr:rRNA pseudouridine synthase [Saprospiraceae bacterium]
MHKNDKSDRNNPFYRKTKAPKEELTFPVRLNKFVARSGITSRRKAVDLIKEGKVLVNQEVVVEPFHLVEEGDVVTYEGRQLTPEIERIYILLNKPKDTICTTSDEKGRKTVFDIIDFTGKERLFPVGRLDRHTTGLLLLTNDGDLAMKLSHPSHKVQKRYLVKLDKPISQAHLDQIKAGIELEDGLAPVQNLEIVDEIGKELLISIVIGRNRIVRRIFEHCNYVVEHLDRVFYGGLTKKGLGRGKYRTLNSREVIMLKHFV